MSDVSTTKDNNLRHSAEEAGASLSALRIDAENAVASVLHGEHAQSKPGMGEKFWQYREYVPGDRPQDIDWRQTAKTEHVFIKQKEWQTPQSVIFWCNQSASMDFRSKDKIPHKIDVARIFTLAMALIMLRSGEKVGIFGSRKVGRSENTLLDIEMKLTEDIRSTLPLADYSMYDLPQHASFVQIGDFLEPLDLIEHNFKQFSGRCSGGFVIQVLDPAELDLPYDGRVLFEDGNANRQQIDNVGSVRAAYKKRIREHNAALQQLCKENQWHYIQHRTDQDIKETLMNIRAALSYEHITAEAE